LTGLSDELRNIEMATLPGTVRGDWEVKQPDLARSRSNGLAASPQQAIGAPHRMESSLIQLMMSFFYQLS
jgi:hypothetical protein